MTVKNSFLKAAAGVGIIAYTVGAIHDFYYRDSLRETVISDIPPTVFTFLFTNKKVDNALGLPKIGYENFSPRVSWEIAKAESFPEYDAKIIRLALSRMNERNRALSVSVLPKDIFVSSKQDDFSDATLSQAMAGVARIQQIYSSNTDVILSLAKTGDLKSGVSIEEVIETNRKLSVLTLER